MLYFNLFYIFACDLFIQESYRLILEENVCIIRMTWEGLSLSRSGRTSHKMVINWKTVLANISVNSNSFQATHLPQFHSWQSVLPRYQISTDVLYYFFLCQEVPYHMDFCLLDSCLLLSWISYFSAVFLTYFNSFFHLPYQLFYAC